MRRFPVAVLGWVLVLLAGCSMLAPVDYRFNPDFDWSASGRWAWAPMKAPEIADERVDEKKLDERIRAAVAANLASKGWNEAGASQASVLVGYSVGLEDRTYHGDTLPRRWGDGPFDISYEVGTLQIVLIDPANERVLWSGTYQSEIDSRTPGKRVDRAVDWVLEGFPP